MKIGNQGINQWPDCFTRGIAAISYYDKNDEPIIGDCRRITLDEYDEIWRQKRPHAGTARASLRNVAYYMRPGDTIYVKSGPMIDGKGKVVKSYDYNPNILSGAEQPWEHYVKVKWEPDFIPFELLLGSEPTTVLKLEGNRLHKLLKEESRNNKKIKSMEVKEGKQYVSEVKFRQRNGALIEMKKSQSDYRCEVCKMKFKDRYGKIGEEYIIVHHLKTIGGRSRSSKTTLEDIALVCSNCHDMLHMKTPPYTINELRRLFLTNQ